MRFKIRKVGQTIPDFSFKDLNSGLITNESMKGKIVVIKCWYIHLLLALRISSKFSAKI
jgi:hypothetical protein